MKKIGKIIGFVLICIFIGGLSYIVTKYLDKNLYLNTELLVTLEDTKEFKLESTDKLTKEETLKMYPNTFKIENKNIKRVSYKVYLNTKDDVEDISYILYLNDKEVGDGKLSELNDNLLYEKKINKKKTDTYKLYLYLTKEKENFDFTYSLEVDSM